MAAATATLSPFFSMIMASSKLCDSGSGTLPTGYVRLQRRHVVAAKSGEIIKMSSFSRKLKRGNLMRASVTEQQQEEETTQISTPQEQEDKEKIVEEEAAAGSPSDNPVSISISPSDLLTMFFQAEGTMTETAVPTVTKSLEGLLQNEGTAIYKDFNEIEGISNLKIQLLEGIASIELTKQTTVQATGVASSLVEIIQGSGFKLQTLNLSFEDEEDIN